MDFIMGGKLKNLKSCFWPEKFTSIGPECARGCRVAAFGGVCFLGRVDFVNIFMISDF